ncbi:hypothetical protein FS593_12205 [Lelliottia amnigena]|uniref:hypothetical protein n=1 Tax=Lelliottia amnigena TaxID=61646 RepID=UPI003AF31C29|nr:hypothetical protein FS593_12205 [Lelliottia amnigena]
MFQPLWHHACAICFTYGWFEWKRKAIISSPTSFTEQTGCPIFMAAIGGILSE